MEAVTEFFTKLTDILGVEIPDITAMSAVTAVLLGAFALVSCFFGYKIFHEHDIKKKLCGTIIMVLGACTILL